MKNTVKKCLLVFCVMNLVGIAVALFLASGLGSDSIGLLCDGIRHVLPVSFGNASLLYNLLIIVVAFIVAKENLGLGTVVYALVSGYFIDFYGYVIELLKVNENIMAVRILSFIIGQCCLSLGLAILIQLKLGMNALDAVLYKIQEKSKLPYAGLRTGCDISYVILGTLMGGTFGIGTICSVLLTGTMVSKIIKVIEKSITGDKYEAGKVMGKI
nr:hypothetical protein [uncultured Dorea sp.]